MKRCLSCNTVYESIKHECPLCSFHALRVNNLYVHAPKLSQEKGGFNKAYFSKLAQLEESHFWFRARNRMILWLLENYSSGINSLMEIGCGTGFVLGGIADKFHGIHLYASDIYREGLHYAANRVPNAYFMQMDARKIPYYQEFDVVAAFDVLEHIPEDEQVLSEVYTSLKFNGLLFVTVPQHMWLWSKADESACHVRRYAAKDLMDKIQKSGFQIIRSTSFVTTLLPFMIASRIKHQYTTNYDAMSELKLHPYLNYILYHILCIEMSIIAKGVNFSMGGSRLVIAKKQ